MPSRLRPSAIVRVGTSSWKSSHTTVVVREALAFDFNRYPPELGQDIQVEIVSGDDVATFSNRKILPFDPRDASRSTTDDRSGLLLSNLSTIHERARSNTPIGQPEKADIQKAAEHWKGEVPGIWEIPNYLHAYSKPEISHLTWSEVDLPMSERTRGYVAAATEAARTALGKALEIRDAGSRSDMLRGVLAVAHAIGDSSLRAEVEPMLLNTTGTKPELPFP